MRDEYENIPGRHRFGGETGPITLRQLARELNFWIIVVILACCAFWGWVGYNVVRWIP